MRQQPSSRSGLSALEIVAAFAVLLVIVGVVGPALGGKLALARQARARTALKDVSDAFNRYRVDTGRWPANGEFDPSATTAGDLVGYGCLYVRPDGLEGWSGPYLKAGHPQGACVEIARVDEDERGGLLDPWGRPYQVHSFAHGYAMTHGAIALVCIGPDGELDSTPLDLVGGRAADDDVVLLVTRKL